MEREEQIILKVEDKHGRIFARGCPIFETVRRARPELSAGRIVKVVQRGEAPFVQGVERGEWVIRSAVPVYEKGGVPTDKVVLVLHRLADVYPGRGGRAVRPNDAPRLFDNL